MNAAQPRVFTGGVLPWCWWFSFARPVTLASGGLHESRYSSGAWPLSICLIARGLSCGICPWTIGQDASSVCGHAVPRAGRSSALDRSAAPQRQVQPWNRACWRWTARARTERWLTCRQGEHRFDLCLFRRGGGLSAVRCRRMFRKGLWQLFLQFKRAPALGQQRRDRARKRRARNHRLRVRS